METENKAGMGGMAVVEKRGEMAVAAMAAKAKAEVEARFLIAMDPRNRRDVMQVRDNILASCKRDMFAQGAIYRKPVGGQKTVDGFSIRFAEEALKAMKNISVDTMTIYEDDDRRMVRISVTDLESNTTYADEVSIAKTVERRQLKEGQTAISERMNSTGQKVFLVAATDDDLLNKVNASKSKAIRNSGLRLIPQDILEEAWQEIEKTREKGGGDPMAETKKVCDSFSKLNIRPAQLAEYLGHELETVSPKELSDLRAIYTAIKDEETSWAAVMETRQPKKPKQEGPGDDGDLGPQSKVIDVQASKTAADAISGAEKKPYDQLMQLIKDTDGVTEPKVITYLKSVDMIGKDAIELLQASDSKMRQLIKSWKSVSQTIKSLPENQS